MRGSAVKTPERVAEAARLRAEGWLLREIAEQFGVATQTVDTWLQDPDGARIRARKDSYAKPCVDCGAMTSGSEGRREEPRCHQCAAIKHGAEAKIWTREAITLAIEEWAHLHGEPPAVPDWNPTQARILNDEPRARRFEDADGIWPHAQSVRRAFGSWAAAIEAAGFVPRAPHGGGGNQYRRHRSRRVAA